MRKKNSIRLMFNSALVALVMAASVGVASAQDEPAVVAVSVEGTVEVQLPGEQAWNDLQEGQIIELDSRVGTSFDSSVELAVGETATVTAGQLTRVRVTDLIEEEGLERSDIELEIGRIEGEVQRTADRDAEFNLNSPVATASVRGTRFDFDGERLQVAEGVVAISNQLGQEVLVAATEESSTDGTAFPVTPPQERTRRRRVSARTSGGSGFVVRGPGGRDVQVRSPEDESVVTLRWGYEE